MTAESAQGGWSFENGKIIFSLGHLAKSSETEMKIHVVPISEGTITNVASVRMNGPEVTTENNTATIVSIVKGRSLPHLAIERATASINLLRVVGLSGSDTRIEYSNDLKSWLTLTNVIGSNLTLELFDVLSSGADQRFYRASTGATSGAR